MFEVDLCLFRLNCAASERILHIDRMDIESQTALLPQVVSCTSVTYENAQDCTSRPETALEAIH